MHFAKFPMLVFQLSYLLLSSSIASLSMDLLFHYLIGVFWRCCSGREHKQSQNGRYLLVGKDKWHLVTVDRKLNRRDRVVASYLHGFFLQMSYL